MRIYSISVNDDSCESTLSLNRVDSYAYPSPIKSVTYNADYGRVCILVENRCELLYSTDLAKGEYKSLITPFKKDATCCFCMHGAFFCFVLRIDSILFCGSDTITRISFTGQISEQSFSHPILAIDAINKSIALLLANGDAVFLFGPDLREESRISIPSITETSICTLLWGDASHLLLGVASSSSLHLFLLSHSSTWSSTELEPLCMPDTGRPFASRWSLCFDITLGLFVASHAASSELCLVSYNDAEWKLLSASDGENVCVPLDDCFEPLAVERMAVVREGDRSFLLFATDGEDAAAGIRRAYDDDVIILPTPFDFRENDADDFVFDVDPGCVCTTVINMDEDSISLDCPRLFMDDEYHYYDENVPSDLGDHSVKDDDADITFNEYGLPVVDGIINIDNTANDDNHNDNTPDETPIPIDNDYQTLLPPPLSLPAAIPALRALRQQMQRHRDHRKQLRKQLESLPRESQLPPSQRILRAIEEETAVLTQLKEAKRSLRDYLAKSAESIRLGSQHPHSLRWDLLARGFLGTDACAILAPSAPETNVVVESLDRFFSEKPSSLHVSFASLKSRTIASMAQEWRSDSGKRVSERCREEVFEVLLREEREREREREVAAAKEAARAKEEERKRQAEETLLKEKERKEKERREKEKEEKERKGKKEMPATTNPFAATQSSGVSGTKENGMVEKPGVSQPAKNTVNNGPFNAVTQTSGNFGKKMEGNGGLFGKAGEAQNGGLFGKPAANGGVFNKPAGNTENPFNQPAGNGGLFSKPAESAGKGGLFGQTTETNGGLFGKPAANGGMFNKPAENNGGLFGKPAENQNGGLFGKPAESGSGMFNKPAEPNAGLFSKPAEPNAGLFSKPAASGGLFSSQGGFTSQQSQGGLFGGGQQSAFNAPKGGLFASQAKQVNPVAVLMSCHIG